MPRMQLTIPRIAVATLPTIYGLNGNLVDLRIFSSYRGYIGVGKDRGFRRGLLLRDRMINYNFITAAYRGIEWVKILDTHVGELYF